MKLSVAICTFNGAKFLEQQLASIDRQSVPVDEVVLVDDGSVDSTLSIAAKFSEAGRTPLKIFQNSTRLGSTLNFERSITLCSGDLIFLADQDDVWAANKVEQMRAAFLDDADLLLAHSDARMVDEQGSSLGYTLFEALGCTHEEIAAAHRQNAFTALLKRNTVTGATVAFRQRLMDWARPFPAHSVHDEWLAWIASALGRTALVPGALIDYRQHGGNQIGAQRRSIGEKLRYAIATPASFYDLQRQRAESLTARLRQISNGVSEDFLRSAEMKLAHETVRRFLPGPRLLRLPTIAQELLSGRYWRYSIGLKSALRDLLARRK
jgi:glycosyltransferase involved in cell wall biosynthesis